MKMTIPTQLKTLASKAESVWKKKRAKKIKPVKKNTLHRNLRAMDLRYDHRQEPPSATLSVVDETQRVCSNCGYEYVGRHCPQCGQVGVWNRYTFKQAVLNFLDIWGLGNRPMFRTLKELFSRPGYMVRDYLSGHRQYYFPPFKLMALVIMLLVFLSLLPGVEMESNFAWARDLNIKDERFPDSWIAVINWCVGVAQFLSQNSLYEWLVFGIFQVICIWIAFKPVSRYNLVEIYIFQIYLFSQQLICQVPIMLYDGWVTFSTNHVAAWQWLSNLTPLALMLAGLISKLMVCIMLFLSVLSFKQFFKLGWKSTILRLLFSSVVAVWIIMMVAFVFAMPVFDKENPEVYVYGAICLLLIPLAFILARKFFDKNESMVPRKVIGIGKGLMLMVLLTPIVSVGLHEEHYATWLTSVISVLYVVMAVAFSFLPIVLYRKFQRIWVAFIPILWISLPLYWLVME